VGRNTFDARPMSGLIGGGTLRASTVTFGGLIAHHTDGGNPQPTPHYKRPNSGGSMARGERVRRALFYSLIRGWIGGA